MRKEGERKGENTDARIGSTEQGPMTEGRKEGGEKENIRKQRMAGYVWRERDRKGENTGGDRSKCLYEGRKDGKEAGKRRG